MAAGERGASGVALVTGAARGIGFEVARQLGRRGMTVILGARNAEKAAAAAEQLAGEGLDARAWTVDVADGGSVERLAAGVEEEFGRPDVLVNNVAAFADWSETASTADLESSRAVLDTNLFGAWRACQAFLLVNVSSGAGSHKEPQFGLTAGGGTAPATGSLRRRSTPSPRSWPRSSTVPASSSTPSTPV